MAETGLFRFAVHALWSRVPKLDIRSGMKKVALITALIGMLNGSGTGGHPSIWPEPLNLTSEF